MTEVVIVNNVPDSAGFKRAVAAYAREDARIALERNNSLQGRQHANLLEQLATLVEGLDADAHEIGALYDAQVNRGLSPRERGYQPGARASKVLGNVGFTEGNPKPAELLAELVRAAQADLISEKAAHTQTAADDAVRRVRGDIETKATAAIERAQIKQQKAEAKAAQFESDLAAARKQVTHLLAFAHRMATSLSPPNRTPNPRPRNGSSGRRLSRTSI